MNIRSGFHGQFNQRNTNNNNANNGSGGWNSSQSQSTQLDSQALSRSFDIGGNTSNGNNAPNSGWDGSNWGNGNGANADTWNCSNTGTVTGGSNTNSNTATNTNSNSDTSSSGGDQSLAGIQQILTSMLSMMTQMMSGLLGNPSTSTSTTPSLSPAPAPVIDPSQIDFSNDSNLQQRQYDLIGGRNSQIDTLLNTVNTSDPSSTESADAQQQISDLWTQANGDPNALKEFTTLQTVRKENSVISSLTTTQQSVDPNSAEYTSITNQIAGSQLIQQGEIAIAKALETGLSA